MIDSSAAAPPLLLQLLLLQQTKLTGIDVVVATNEALKLKLFRRKVAMKSCAAEEASESRTKLQRLKP
jgi:hypothetical protein